MWWSRFAFPTLRSWAEDDEFQKLHQQTVPKDDPDRKALACYGLLVRYAHSTQDQMLLRFVERRPASAITTQFLTWSCDQLATQGFKALLLIWDNATWHKSKIVQAWIKDHNQQVKQQKTGIRIVPLLLPVKSPWLNPIEPKWVHGKRAVVEPDRLLSAQELADRVCDYFDCPYLPPLSIPD